MQKKYIFFDFDGTLVDTSSGIYIALKSVFKAYNQPILDEKGMRKYIGPPLEYSFSTFNGLSEKDALDATEVFRKSYKTEGVYKHKLYDDIEELLKKLKNTGKILAVATSKPEDFAKLILESYNLTEYFTVISGATFDGTRSKKKDVLQYAVDELKITDLSECVLIGDTKNDVNCATQVGMDCVGVLYGFGLKSELEEAGAKATVQTPLDILKIIE